MKFLFRDAGNQLEWRPAAITLKELSQHTILDQGEFKRLREFQVVRPHDDGVVAEQIVDQIGEFPGGAN